MNEYDLVCEVIGHHQDVRSLCVLMPGRQGNGATIVSGSRDAVVKMWHGSSDGRSYSEGKSIYNHEHWVGALLALPDSLGGGFVSGCQDKKIRRFDENGDLVGTIEGHLGPVTSLSLTSTNELISGSWDGTARTWKLRDDGSVTCTSVLADHENGVCVLGLPNGTIATGSAGKQIGQTIEGFQIRIWKDGQQVKSMQQHRGAIRALAHGSDENTFWSCSNDGSTREWTLDGELLQVVQNPVGADGNRAFSFSLSVIPGTGEIVTGNDDFCARVWDGENLVQEIIHPCTVWWIVVLDNGDIITAGSDSAIRVFSRSDERKADETVREFYAQQTAKTIQEASAKATPGGGGGIDVSKLARIEEAGPGSSDGQVKMFNKNGSPWVYSWSAASATWVEVGKAMGQAGNDGGGGMIDGVQYERVLPVELEDPSTGGVRKLEIGFNSGDNPYLIAQNFVNKHGLPDGYVEDVANYIRNNRGQTNVPTIDMSGGASAGSPMEIDTPPPANGTFPMPDSTGMAFETGKLDSILDKIAEFNTQVGDSKLNESDISTLESLVGTLKDQSRYHSSKFTRKQIDVLLKLLCWDPDHIFPVFDLTRILLIHPDGAKSLGQDQCSSLLEMAIRMASDEHNSLALSLTAVRVVANMFRHSPGANAVKKILVGGDGIDMIIEPLRYLSSHSNKNVRLAVATCLYNCANVIYHNKAGSSNLKGAIYASAIELGIRAVETEEPETARRCLMTVGTIILIGGKFGDNWKDSLSELLEAASTLSEPGSRLAKCISEVRKAQNSS